MGKGMTDSNPDYTRTRAELSGLNQQLQALMKGGAGDDDVILAKSKAPEVGLTYVRKLRDVKYYETLFELLARQYEMARLDEANQAPSSRWSITLCRQKRKRAPSVRWWSCWPRWPGCCCLSSLRLWAMRSACSKPIRPRPSAWRNCAA